MCPMCDLISKAIEDPRVLFARAFILGIGQAPGRNRFGPLCPPCHEALQEAHTQDQQHRASSPDRPPAKA